MTTIPTTTTAGGTASHMTPAMPPVTRCNASRPLIQIGHAPIEVIDRPVTPEEAEIEAVAGETLLMRYGDDTGLVERITANRMLPEVLAEVGETEEKQQAAERRERIAKHSADEEEGDRAGVPVHGVLS